MSINSPSPLFSRYPEIKSQKRWRSVLLGLVALGVCGGGGASAEVISFESPGDLTSYSLFRSHGTEPWTEVIAGEGVGAPSTGGLRFTPNNSSRRTALLLRPQESAIANKTVWESSILVNGREIDDGNPPDRKTDVRLGFAATNTTGSNLHDFFHKTNRSISVLATWEHKPSGTLRRLTFELFNRGASEQKWGQVQLNNSAYFDDWLRISLRVERAGSTTFAATYVVESLGADGTGPAVMLGTFTQTEILNPDLASASGVYAGFLNSSDKTATTTKIYFDEHATIYSAVAPDAPTALAPSNLSTSAALLHWEAPSQGLPPTAFLLEISLATDHFAAGTLIGAHGETGLSEGITIADPAATSLFVQGLESNTAYRYRVRAINAAGPGAPSDTMDFTTIQEGVNAPPTLDPVADQPAISTSAGLQTLTLTGISPGLGDEGQEVTITAVSSHPEIIPHPQIEYSNPDSVGFLHYQAGGTQGTAEITVTVDDGQAENQTMTRTFAVQAIPLPELLVTMDTEEEFNAHFSVFQGSGGTLAWGPHSGAEGLGGLSSQGTVFDVDNDALVVREQPFPGLPTALRTSLMVNFREIAATIDETKGEVQIGFVDSLDAPPAKRKNFFQSGRSSIRLRVTAEHEPGKKEHEFALRVMSYNGSSNSQSVEQKISDGVAMENWLRITLEGEPLGGGEIRLTYRIEDYGPEGNEPFPSLVATGSFTATNSPFLSAPLLYAAFTQGTDKKDLVSRIYSDAHEALVLREAPGVPIPQAAPQKTAVSFRAAWASGSIPAPLSYLLEISKASDNFSPGTLLGLDGQPQGSVGVLLGSQTSQWITGLEPSTQYLYRLRGVNYAGMSVSSQAMSVTTLAAGENAAPTLDPIVPLILSTGSAPQSVGLTGISDGGEGNQPLTVTAVSSDPALVPDPLVTYSSPESIGTLTVAPAAGAAGDALITVTVDDGAASDSSTQQTFLVSLRSPSQRDSFESPGALDAYALSGFNAQLSLETGSGIADPETGLPGNALNYSRLAGGNNSLLVVHPQSFPGNPTLLQTSLMLHLGDMETFPQGKATIRLGIATSPTPTSEPKKFFETDRSSLLLQLTAEHNPSKGKLHEIEIVPTSHAGNSKSEGQKLSLSEEEAFAGWVRLGFVATPLNSTLIQIDYTLESFGPDGLGPASLLAEGFFVVANSQFQSAPVLFAAFAIEGSKETNAQSLLLDDYFVEILRVAPEAPLLSSATQITPHNALLRWLPSPTGAVPLSYLVEVTLAADNFAPGTFLALNGTPGQPAGIVVSDPDITSLRITGLQPSTDYAYRVVGINSVGESAKSSPSTFSTLDDGENAPPTVDPPPPLTILKDAIEQEVLLTGITDGGEMNQPLDLWVEFDNPSLIETAEIETGFGPASQARLRFTPIEGQTGTASFEIFVDDGLDTVSVPFVVHVIDPEPLMTFSAASELAGLTRHSAGIQPTFLAPAGATPVDGAVLIDRSSSGGQIALLRPYAMDGLASGSLRSAIFIRAADLVASENGKIDLRLAFIGEETPGSNLKDFFHKVHPALGVHFQIQHEPGNSSKERNLSVRAYSFNGSTEVKGNKTEVSDTPAAENWLRLAFSAVRTGQSTYLITFDLEDWGAEGSTFQGRVLTGVPLEVTNSALAADRLLFAGFLLHADTPGSDILLDNHFVLADTTSPFAPSLYPAFGVSGFSLTTAWEPSIFGREPTGFLVELSTLEDAFAPGTLFDLVGNSGQTQGVTLNDPFAFSLTFTGLTPHTAYIWRVLPVRNDSVGLPAGSRITVTTGLTLEEWRQRIFTPAQLADPTISGPHADPNGNGLPNYAEFALGTHPLDSATPPTTLTVDADGHMRMTFRRLAGSQQVLIEAQMSSDLATWTTVGVIEESVSATDAEGYQTVVVRDQTPLSQGGRRFLRVRVVPQF